MFCLLLSFVVPSCARGLRGERGRRFRVPLLRCGDVVGESDQRHNKTRAACVLALNVGIGITAQYPITPPRQQQQRGQQQHTPLAGTPLFVPPPCPPRLRCSMAASAADEDVLRNSLPAVEHSLGYRFLDRRLLLTALTHRSFCNEADTASGDFDELEWLGDAVLQLAVSSWLFRTAKGSRRKSGQLSTTRQRFVSAGACESFARQLNLVRLRETSCPSQHKCWRAAVELGWKGEASRSFYSLFAVCCVYMYIARRLMLRVGRVRLCESNLQFENFELLSSLRSPEGVGR